jgi:hypothetical protein
LSAAFRHCPNLQVPSVGVQLGSQGRFRRRRQEALQLTQEVLIPSP